MKITITIEDHPRRGGAYISLEEFEAWKREREQERLRQERERRDSSCFDRFWDRQRK